MEPVELDADDSDLLNNVIADLIIILGSLRTEYTAFDDEWAVGNYYTSGIFSAKALVTALIGVELALN